MEAQQFFSPAKRSQHMFRSALPVGWIKQRLPGSPLSGGRKRGERAPRWPGVCLRLEPLEDRTLLSVLVINDTTNPNPTTWLVTATSITETVLGQPPITQQTSDFSGVVINAGTGGNTFDVQSIATGIPLTINSQAADTVNLGNTTHGVRDILADVTLTNPSQATTLFADDSADAIGRPVSITSAGITGLAPGNINIPTGPCRSVTILGGSGGNVFSMPVGPPSLPAGLTIQGRGVADALTVNDQADTLASLWSITGMQISLAHGTAATPNGPPQRIFFSNLGAVEIDGGSGGNVFTMPVGPPQIPTGPPQFTIQGGGVADALTINDRADTLASQWSITGTLISLAHGTAAVPQGPPQRIFYSNLGAVEIDGGSGGNVFSMPSGPPQTPSGPPQFTIQGGGVADSLTINDQSDTLASQWSISGTQIILAHGTAAVPSGPPAKIFYSNLGAVEIDGGSGGNVFSVPSGPPQISSGPPQFTIQGGGVADALIVNDQADTLASLWSVTGTQISLAHGTTAMPNGPPSKIFYSNLGAVEVDGGSGGNVFSMPNGPPALPAGLTVQGGGLADSLTVNDQADTLATQWSITGTQISLAHSTPVVPSGPPRNIFYSSLGALQIQGGSGGNNYTVDMATLPPSLTLRDTTGTDQVTIFAPPGNNVLSLSATQLSATGGAGSGKNINFDLGATVTSFTINGGGTNQVVLVGNPPGPLTLVQVAPYTFSGFLPPLNKNLAFASGRTVPIKFQLTDLNGNFISSLSDVTALAVIYPDGSAHAISGLRYDATANQFIANWSTKGLATGSYTISLSLLDGTTQTVTVQLTTTHSSAGMTTTTAGGTSAAPGGLLGGNIDLFVDNTNGELTADELARIQDAVAAVDTVTGLYGVAVAEVADPRLADVTLHMDTTSAVGGYAEGVLGCTTDAGQITIIQGWNFYAGSDASQITSAQYDFETVVSHELGHALGLGHSLDSTSVMFATLNTGMVNRSLISADLNVADSDTTGACGLHAAPVLAEAVDFPPIAYSAFGGATANVQTSQKSADNFPSQAVLNAASTDWPSGSGFSDRHTSLLIGPQSPSHCLAHPSIDEQNEFWSLIGGSMALDRITDLTAHLGR
jgi:hypothetical protein